MSLIILDKYEGHREVIDSGVVEVAGDGVDGRSGHCLISFGNVPNEHVRHNQYGFVSRLLKSARLLRVIEGQGRAASKTCAMALILS